MAEKVRTRIAPSPTGFLHIGTAQIALFNWLFAQHEKGEFLVRIEDTDKERSKKEFEDDALEGLKWLGLEWDEFYRQSDRTDIYKKYIEQLLDSGKAFWCHHTKEELEKEKKAQQERKEAPRHLCEYKKEGGTGVDRGIIRLSVDHDSDKKIRFTDLIKGEIEFEEKLIGDFSIAKDQDTPLFHLANVVDDFEMNITNVIRGDDLLANVPRQILLRETLGLTGIQYAHMPMILAPDKSKLSKRHSATALHEYRELGYLPEGIINYLTLLGFSLPEDREIIEINELIKIFDLTKVHQSGAVFDIKKLGWVNGEYIKKMSNNDLAEMLKPMIEQIFKTDIKEETLLQLTPLFRERMKKLSDIKDFDYFFKEPEYDKELLIWKARTDKEVKNSLTEVRRILESNGLDDIQKLREQLDELGKRLKDRGLVYWPLRAALTGKDKSPDPVDIAGVLVSNMGIDEILKRIDKAIGKL
ncbi:MAG: glutamate--tRNA ligase [Parcubacteria group bacterium]